jgi:beta-glucosidase
MPVLGWIIKVTAVVGLSVRFGIQSEGVMADAKHYTAYNQETARLLVNEVVPKRALEELYQVPFHAAVQQADVASIMCAYGSLNGVNDCSSPFLYKSLSSWGFSAVQRRTRRRGIRDSAIEWR